MTEYLTSDEKQSLRALVDHAALQAAAEKLNAAREQLAKANLAHSDAKRAHAEAQAVSAMAVAGEGGIDPVQAERLLEDAARAVLVREKIVAHATGALQKAEADHQAARNVACAPVYIEGVRRKVAAARKADQARAMLAEAEADYRLGDRTLAFASLDLGVPHVINEAMLGNKIHTEAHERAIWAGVHVDVDAGWMPGMPRQAAAA